jgi:hypothetical protein
MDWLKAQSLLKADPSGFSRSHKTEITDEENPPFIARSALLPERIPKAGTRKRSRVNVQADRFRGGGPSDQMAGARTMSDMGTLRKQSNTAP